MTDADIHDDVPVTERERIVDAALELAELRGWDSVHVYEVAEALGVPLAEIARHFADKDAIAEAWFDRADRALLRAPDAPDWSMPSPRERLHRTMFAWFDALAAHRRVTRDMLGYKLKPEHLHLQIHGLARISRTVQWIREAARLPAAGLRRELEEVALTTIYVTTFAYWLRDDSPGAERTHAFLNRLLNLAERSASLLSRRP